MSSRHILIIGLAVIVTVLAIWNVTATTSADAVQLDGGWRYRWEENASWQPYSPGKGPERAGHAGLWLETTIPAASRARQALFIPSYTAFQSFEVRIGDRLLYGSGSLPARFADRHRYLLWHLIDLPADAAGKTVTFHFSSAHPRFIGLIGPVWLGEPFSIQKHFVLAHLPVAILAAIFILIGGASLAAACFFVSATRAQWYAFAQAALGAGCYLFSESNISPMVITLPVLASYIHYLSFFLFITGICRYFEPLIVGPCRTILIRIMQLFTLYPFLATLLDLTGIVSWDDSFSLALLLVMVAVCWLTALICSSRFTSADPHDAALIRAAFIPLFLSGLSDAAVGLRLIGSGPLLYPWGLLVLMGALFYRLLLRDREERIAARVSLEQARHAEETAIANERQRIAHDIHDGLSQDLATMSMRASVWEHLVHSDREKMTEEIILFRRLLNKNIGEVRRAIFALRPLDLDELGFVKAMERYVRHFGQYTGLRIALEMTGAESMPHSLEPELYRIVQETLNNVAKHAGATEATVTVRNDGDRRLVLTVTDNGRGFDPALLAGTPRLGLRQMRERVENRNGAFRIQSAPGAGTEVMIRFPLRDSQTAG